MKNMSAIAPAISTGNCAGDLTGNSNGKRRDPRMLTVIAGRARLRSLRKNQGFVSGHRLSDAERNADTIGFNRWPAAKAQRLKPILGFNAVPACLKACPDTNLRLGKET